MQVRGLQCVLGTLVVFLAVNFLSCMHERKLVSMAVHPATFEFLTPDSSLNAQFTALGSYIHPPDTRDITDRVEWKTDVPQLLILNGGVISPSGNGCGIADVSASMREDGNLVTGFATVIVDDPTNPVCPGGSATHGVVTVALTGTGAGSVTSSPSGIDCPSHACGAQFNVGDTIVLTATPNSGFTFGGWTGCDETNGTTCSVLVQKGSVGVAVTFN